MDMTSTLNAGDELQGSIDVPLLPDLEFGNNRIQQLAIILNPHVLIPLSGYTGVGYSV